MPGERKMSWFHCGRCGSLFLSHAGDIDDRLCQKCGFDPSHGIMESPGVTDEETGTDTVKKSELPEPRAKRSGKKRKNQHFMLKLVGGWTLILVLIVVVARRMWHVEAPQGKAPLADVVTAPSDTQDENTLLNQATPQCAQAFASFLVAGTPEERNQYVLTPVSTASRMARFYSMNPLTSIDPKTIALTNSTVLKLPEGNALETHWNTEDGRILDAVFREENDEWRLDWDHFARFSTYPWSLFLAGSGDPEGEFRLLVRERLAEERRSSEAISVVLYAPRFGSPSDTGFQSPEFLVSRNSRDGQLLDAAFKLAKSGKRVFDAKLPALDPEGMIRVRVKVKRTELDSERKFEITGVLACHWLSTDHPGVEADAPAVEVPQNR